MRAVTARADARLLDELVADADVVIDCCDNFTTRHAVNAACVRHGKPLVSGAAIRFDGQISVYDTRDDKCPCYACVFPPAQEFEETRCATMGVFAPLVGIIGAMQAAEALKLLAARARRWPGGCRCWMGARWNGARCGCRAIRRARSAVVPSGRHSGLDPQSIATRGSRIKSGMTPASDQFLQPSDQCIGHFQPLVPRPALQHQPAFAGQPHALIHQHLGDDGLHPLEIDVASAQCGRIDDDEGLPDARRVAFVHEERRRLETEASPGQAP